MDKLIQLLRKADLALKLFWDFRELDLVPSSHTDFVWPWASQFHLFVPQFYFLILTLSMKFCPSALSSKLSMTYFKCQQFKKGKTLFNSSLWKHFPTGVLSATSRYTTAFGTGVMPPAWLEPRPAPATAAVDTNRRGAWLQPVRGCGFSPKCWLAGWLAAHHPLPPVSVQLATCHPTPSWSASRVPRCFFI